VRAAVIVAGYEGMSDCSTGYKSLGLSMNLTRKCGGVSVRRRVLGEDGKGTEQRREAKSKDSRPRVLDARVRGNATIIQQRREGLKE